MTQLLSRPAASPGDAHNTAVRRDVVVDLARAVCLLVVVLFHGIMMGVQLDPVRGWQVTNAFEGQAFFPVLSLFLQVMPLFFILGGFSSFGAWERRRQAGRSAGSFIRERLLRLGRPAIVVFGVVGLGLVLLAASGVPADLLGQIGFRISQPMWFLAVYLGCSAVVPVMAAAHRRAPWLTVGALLVAVIAVDLLRAGTGIEGIGFANLIFVWALMQQIGFFVAQGMRLSRLTLVMIFAGALGLLLAGAALAWWPLDMLTNLNPPRFPLVLLGMAQLALLEINRTALQRCAERPRLRRASDFANTNSLTIYLWHASAMAGLIGLMLLIGSPMPEPLSLAWWASRGIWLTTLLAVVIPLAGYLSRFEKLPSQAVSGGDSRHVVLAILLAVTAVVLVLATGSNPASWLLATLGLMTALRLASGGSRTADLRPQRFSGEPWWLAGRRAILS
ncbi:acyltransferase family protein [Psychromicrobium lacuslunae]|uniref:acyltransferase family protein n=1 Tax=Psychromicrobium lacuslunae TaxID=1618207 RepID=UPI0006967E08|nr:acyltransferase [Psychromicrobium lacuslunae]